MFYTCNNYILNHLKHLKRWVLFLFVIANTQLTIAQYTEVINSNKPGFSESPYSVGKGVYQFESSLFLRNLSIEPTFSKPQSLGIDVLFRTSFFLERLEFNTQLTYQRDKIAFKNIFTSEEFSTGLRRATIGAKYLIFEPKYEDKSKEVRSWKRRFAFDKKRLIPSVAIYLGVNTDFVNSIHKTQQMSPKAGILLQHNLTNDFNIITNLYYDFIGTEFSEYSYIVTATHNLSNRWSAFFENQTVFQKYKNNVNLGVGLAYLYSRNLQINASGRFLSEGNAQGFYTSFGVSYRINKHQDSYTDITENEAKEADTVIGRYNKKQDNFFNRFLNLFKKKDKKRTRSRKKITKKSGFFGLFKKKTKPSKSNKVESDIEKLEREIKELEKEMKKDTTAKKKDSTL